METWAKLFNYGGAGSWASLRSQFPRRMHRRVASSEREMPPVPLFGLSEPWPQRIIQHAARFRTVTHKCPNDGDSLRKNPAAQPELPSEIARFAPTRSFRKCGPRYRCRCCLGNCREWRCAGGTSACCAYILSSTVEFETTNISSIRILTSVCLRGVKWGVSIVLCFVDIIFFIWKLF